MTERSDPPETTLSRSHTPGIGLAANGPRQVDTFTDRRRALGADHPDTLAAANRLANDLSACGRHRQAHDLDVDTFSRVHRTLGVNHRHTLGAANNLAADLRALGRYEQAYHLDTETLNRRRDVLGDRHPDTVASATNLSLTLRALGRHDQADAWTRWAADRDPTR